MARRLHRGRLAEGLRRLVGPGARGWSAVTVNSGGRGRPVAPRPIPRHVTQLVNSIFFAGLYAGAGARADARLRRHAAGQPRPRRHHDRRRLSRRVLQGAPRARSASSRSSSSSRPMLVSPIRSSAAAQPAARRRRGATRVATFGLSLIAQTVSCSARATAVLERTTRSRRAHWVPGADDLRHRLCRRRGRSSSPPTSGSPVCASARRCAPRPRTRRPRPRSGIDVKHVYALTFAIAAGLSAFAGVEIGAAFSLTPTAGSTWLLRRSR